MNDADGALYNRQEFSLPGGPSPLAVDPTQQFLYVGLRAWDASRLIDFLETQELVDASRIGVAGLSGGGTVGLFFAALEDRVRLAMIAGYFNFVNRIAQGLGVEITPGEVSGYLND